MNKLLQESKLSRKYSMPLQNEIFSQIELRVSFSWLEWAFGRFFFLNEEHEKNIGQL